MGLIVSAMLILFALLARQFTPASILTDPNHKISLILSAAYITGITVNILCLPFYCLWINRCCKNAWLLNPPKMKVTPAWAVGYYFIPIVSLWKPYVHMMDIRNASFGMRSDLNKIIALWWLSWLAFLSINAVKLVGHLASNPEVLAIDDKLSTVSGITNIIFNYLSITVILSITNAQNKRASELKR